MIRPGCQKGGGPAVRDRARRTACRHVTKRDQAAILAALQFYRDECLGSGQQIPDLKIRQIATDGDRFQPLTYDEVTRLRARLQTRTKSR